MNELIYNFINQVEDVNKIKEMSVEEFSKIVRDNELISESDATQLIESFRKISMKKNADDESNDSDQRKKKYREKHRELNTDVADKIEKMQNEKENDDNSLER